MMPKSHREQTFDRGRAPPSWQRIRLEDLIADVSDVLRNQFNFEWAHILGHNPKERIMPFYLWLPYIIFSGLFCMSTPKSEPSTIPIDIE